jgi:hypothetical protein
MNTLNDLTIRMIARTDAFVTCLANEEEGSEVAQAAGVALVADRRDVGRAPGAEERGAGRLPEADRHAELLKHNGISLQPGRSNSELRSA